MEAFVEKGNLFLLYSGLLKEKQRQIYEYHILEDMSFTEIGLEMGITRQAAQAVFRKADEKLKVHRRESSPGRKVAQYTALCGRNSEQGAGCGNQSISRRNHSWHLKVYPIV